MRNLTNKQKILIWVSIISITFLTYWLEMKDKNLQIKQAKAELIQKEVELIEAKKPSKIEIQKTELVNLETEWENKQNNIISLRKTADNLEKEKLELETKIRAKRNEILGLKK